MQCSREADNRANWTTATEEMCTEHTVPRRRAQLVLARKIRKGVLEKGYLNWVMKGKTCIYRE